MTDSIYRRPEDYELEHQGDERDVAFYCSVLERLRPGRILELACGSGRLTIPLASSAAARDTTVVGVELSETMLSLARRKADDTREAIGARLSFECGDMRTWTSEASFDLVLIGCSSITHLLTLEDRLVVWRRAYDHLEGGGRFIVDVTMPDIRTFAASLETPPRALVELDVDSQNEQSTERLIRSKTTSYDAWQQRAKVTFLYDKFRRDQPVDRYVSDFESHVYYPDELQLLFRLTGFEVEQVWSDYTFRPAHARSREIVMVGRRPLAQSER